MASSKEYLQFILDSCEELSARAMMGDYVVYYRGRVIGGIYDNRFLVKPTGRAMELMPGAQRQLPYESAKEMLLVDRIDDREFLAELFEAMYEEIPERKK